LALVERASSSLPTNGGGGGGSGGTIARSATTHLVGASRVKSVNYSTCLHRLTRVVVLPAHPGNREDNDGNSNRPEWG
jgi:hypothetical protein